VAKGRMLNREVCISAKFDALSSDRARMFATWTIPWLDKNGVFHATPQIVRAHVTPLREDITAANVEEILTDMERVGLIWRFEAGGRRWQVWPGFSHNQPNLRGERERTDYPIPPSARENPAVDGQLPAEIRQLPEADRQNTSEVQVQQEVQVEVQVQQQQKAAAPLDEAARAAGIDKMPSIRSIKAKAAAKKRDEDRFDLSEIAMEPPIRAYFKHFGIVRLPREAADTILERVSGVYDEQTWDATCEEWARGNTQTGKTWNPLSIDKILDLYGSKLAQKRALAGQNAPNGLSKADAALAILKERGHA